jgi:hemerythrin
MKTFITWEDKYNTGNFVIDYQHQRLVRLINDLVEVQNHEELRPSLVDVILDELGNYTQYHFKTEEDIMESMSFSDIAAHKFLHKEFIQKLSEFKAKYILGEDNIDDKFCRYLKDWLIDHISIEDPRFIMEMSSGQGAV